jgi:16S rRNA (cytosine1402-N4)-methyltransferase
MLEECLTVLATAGERARRKLFVDATFGAGGHTEALLDAVPESVVIAIDADPQAIERARRLARKYPGRIVAEQANFGELDSALDRAGTSKVDGILYDLGLSSLQLAASERGFSFGADDPLDMRRDPSSDAPTASDLLNRLGQAELESILRDFGDERFARPIARAIVRRRARVTTWRTSDLVAAVMRSLPAKHKHQRIHPATRTFLALRITVNAEYSNLERSLDAGVRRLNPKGRMAVISFHSGEDRIVKRRFKTFAQLGLADIITRKPLRPSPAEMAANPKSRSAKLRALVRLSSPPEGTS